MKKQNSILIPLLAIGVVCVVGYQGFNWDDSFVAKEFKSISNPSPTAPLPVTLEAWQVFENYLEFARTHNLVGVRSLSHQVSDTCNDPLKEQECFVLMDTVYTIGDYFKQEDFKHVLADERQIVMFTDPPAVAILYFTRENPPEIKVLGMRFCFEDETSPDKCFDADRVRLDLDDNGWWDNVESLFY